MTRNRLPELGTVEEIRTLVLIALTSGRLAPQPPEPPKPPGPRSTHLLLCRTDDRDTMPDALRKAIARTFPNAVGPVKHHRTDDRDTHQSPENDDPRRPIKESLTESDTSLGPRRRGIELRVNFHGSLAAFPNNQNKSKTMTRKELAELVGVSERTLRNWQNKGCPVDRGFDAVQRWRNTHAQDGKARPTESSETAELKRRLIKAQTEHYQVKTRLAELEHAVSTGELVSMDAVDELLNRLHAPVAQQLKTLADRLAQQVNPADPQHAYQILQAETHALFSLAQGADAE